MRFQGVCFRAHNPQWAFDPTSGDGAAINSARFNPRGMPALYLATSLDGAITEASQGFAHRIPPLTIVAYDVDVDDVIDLTDPGPRAAEGISAADLSCPWKLDLTNGDIPRSWVAAARLVAKDVSGILVPSHAPGAAPEMNNLVLWKWSDSLPYRVEAFDPNRSLPRDQSSWKK